MHNTQPIWLDLGHLRAFLCLNTRYILCLIICLHLFSQYSNVSESFISCICDFLLHGIEDSYWSTYSRKHKHWTESLLRFIVMALTLIKYLAHETRAHALCAHTISGYECFSICAFMPFYQKPVRIYHHHNIQLKSFVFTQRLWLNTKIRQEYGTYMIKANNTKDINGQKTTNLKKLID